VGVDGWPVDEWSLHLTAEQHLAPSTIRGYQCTVRLFTEYLADSRYGWISECERAFDVGVHPVSPGSVSGEDMKALIR
jgi:hypothetical protein